MTRLDPIIAVNDVEASARWYEQIFGFRNGHGGAHFAVLRSETNEVILCLHQWEAHHHPSLTDRDVPAGNGLLLYFRTGNMDVIREKLNEMKWPVEEEVHLNTNSLKKECSFRDPDGYFLTVTEFHEYEG